MKTYSTDGLTFQEEDRFYKKLVDLYSLEYDYKYWEAKCSGMNL